MLIGVSGLAADNSILSGVRFDLDGLSKAPETFPAEEAVVEGVNAIFFKGLDYKGRPTRIFAYYGVPKTTGNASGHRFPAMVLIHGGGGTAFDRWVKLWNSRGYAAIAMDLCGCVPVGTYGNWKRHEHAGPMGWDACFGQLEDPIEDQWTFQATSAVVIAHSLIRSYPEVDSNRIGLTGISWGGYLTCVVAGVDSRFEFAAPVYGCGFLKENSAWLTAFEKLGPDRANLWHQQWDPANYLQKVSVPILWVNGTNDFAYPMDSWQKSYRLHSGSQTLCLGVRMPHGHGPAGENPEEIHVFANSILQEGKPLAKVLNQGQNDGEAYATFTCDEPILKADFNFTTDLGRWQDRKWELIPATLDLNAGRVSAKIPVDAKVFYFNLVDDRQCVVSTPHVER